MPDPKVDETKRSKPPKRTVSEVYFPTIESCWDYGFVRNAPLLPVIGSLLPYSFLRGVQFDTKIFKLWEFVEILKKNGSSFLYGSNSRNEIKLVIREMEKTRILKEVIAKINTTLVPVLTFLGVPVGANPFAVAPVPDSVSIEEAINFAYGDTINIACDGDNSLQFQVQNNWGGGEDILTRILQGGAEIVKNISEVWRTGQNLANPKSDDFATVPFSPKRFKGSEFGDLTITFTLFTRNNFIRDIYKPLIYLKSLCVPSRFGDKEAGDMLVDDVDEIINAYKEKEKEAKDKAQAQTEGSKTQEQLKDWAKGILNQRLKVVTPPPTFRLEHTSGLFFMNNAAIKSFSFQPEGAWVRAEYDALFGKIFNAAGQKSVATALDRLLQDVYIKFPSYNSATYPTRVKCTITFTELDFITRETYRDRELAKFGDIIYTTVGGIADPGYLVGSAIAGGIGQNLDILVPDIKGAGDLLSGGKWVPPGESISGIPGFL
jgi:hypothetical protein